MTRGNYPFYDSQVIDVNGLTSADDYYNESINDNESLDGSTSGIANDAVISSSSSPGKRYPGVAKLSTLAKINTISVNDENSQTLSQSISLDNNLTHKETVIN
jgi:hypothetical protein